MALNCSTAQDVSKVIEENGIEFVDLRFTDLFGQWHHFSVPVDFYDEDALFKSGLGFDGSSIRGFKSIESSDMLLVCDPTTAFVDPMTTNPTLCVIANVYEPGTYEVKVTGEVDPETGYLIDLKYLKELIAEHVEQRFDHKNLNIDTEEFRNLNPTAENICYVIWNILRGQLEDKYELSVRLYETPRNYVEYPA